MKVRVNPEILRWARETAGLDRVTAAKKVGLREARGVAPEDRLAAFEEGKELPTRPLLVRMAKQYRRPLLTFYLSKPPRKGDRGQDFRTLSEARQETDEALLDALLRDVLARHGLVRAVLEDDDEMTPLPFIGSAKPSDGAPALARSIRKAIRFDLERFRAARNSYEAFKRLRAWTESARIFVLLIGDLGSHHSKIPTEAFRGFAVADPIAPFVVINDNDSRAAWSFTLLHELVHLWLGQTGVSDSQTGARDSSTARRTERFCNDVASEILLPSREVEKMSLAREPGALEALVASFARERNVSSSMVAYKLFRAKRIERDTWLSLQSRFKDLWTEKKQEEKKRAQEKGGSANYYATRQSRLGKSLIRLVDRLLSGGELTTTKAGMILGVKPGNVQNLLEAAAG